MNTNLQLYRSDEFTQYATEDLSESEIKELTVYISSGGHPLSPDVAGKLFTLFLNGSDVEELHRLNKALPLGSILDAKIRYKWTVKRDDYASELQAKIQAKVMKAQLETTELITDLLVAAKRKYGDKIKKFIQSGEDADLGNGLSIDSLTSLMRISESLQKITGQDRVQKVKTESTQNINVNVSTGTTLPPEAAAQILAIIANAKQKEKSNAT